MKILRIVSLVATHASVGKRPISRVTNGTRRYLCPCTSVQSTEAERARMKSVEANRFQSH